MKKKSAALAALLSFIFPGLGHLYLGRRRQALVFALPALLVMVAVGLELLTGPDQTLGFLVTPSGSMTALALILLTGGWRMVAMIDAVLIARRQSGLGMPAVAVAALLLVLTAGMHGTAAYVAYSVYDAGSRIFVAAGPDDGSGTAAPESTNGSPTEPGTQDPAATDDYQVAPEVTPATAQSRINILLTGIDSAETRTTALTDTILIVSVNPEDKSVAMLSIPRDISNFPLYNGGTYKGKINSFMTWVRNHPKDFPDKPFPALMKQVGYLLGVPMHYFAAVDLAGFRKLIDAVGGVTVDNPRAINDPKYEWLDGTWGFTLPAGKVKLNGRTALAYARSRQGVGDSDFTRARRQQQLLVALRAKLTTADAITKLPDLIRVAGDTVRTNLPTDRMDEFIDLARTTKGGDIKQYVLGPPYAYHPPNSETGGTYTLRFDMDRLSKLSIKLFGNDSRYAAN